MGKTRVGPDASDLLGACGACPNARRARRLAALLVAAEALPCKMPFVPLYGWVEVRTQPETER